MKCPACRGRLEAKSTRDTDQPGRTLRYRKCRSCGKSYPTIETVLAFRAIPKPAQVTEL
jgi:transcriptional regulator NrdR family protein